MIIGCSIGIAFIAVFYLCTIPYRKNFRKKLDKRQHKLLMLYGLSMFLVDHIPKKIINRSGVISSEIKKLAVKENIQKEKYLYIVEKMSVSVLIIIFSLILGVGINISERNEGSENITELKRDSANVTTYEFYAKGEKGQKESVVVDVQSRQLTEEQIYKLFKESEPELVKKVLKDNKNSEHVDSSLDLVSNIGKNINVTWNISDSSIIDYDGNLSDNIPVEGCVVSLTATMTQNNISQDYTFSLNVFPKVESKSFQEQIQEYVNENDKYQEHIKLPKNINGEAVKYYKEVSKLSGWIVLLGLILAVAIFFLKDQDIKKDVKKRNEQMLRDYPEIVSQILLYYGAGLSLKSSIERMVKEYKKEKQDSKKLFRYAYEELEMTLTKMNSGISEMEAINDYGSRCGLQCYIKFAGILEQNLKRGAREVTYALKNEVNNAMLERKHRALKNGGEISTRLLGPMVVMLIISIAIIMVPALLAMEL